MKIRKIFIRGLLILLAVVTAGLLIRAICNYRMGNKLEEYLGNRQAEGVPISRKALIPECENEKNGAILWKAAEPLVLYEGGNVKLLSEAFENFFYHRPLAPEVREELEEMIARNQRIFDLMREAAEKPCFRYGNRHKKMNEMRIPDMPRMINATRLLGIDAVFKAEKGKIDEAIEEIRWGMRFVRKTMDEPFLISGLVAVANMKYLCFGLEQIIRGRDIDSGILRTLIQELNPGLWRKTFVKGITGERVFFIDSALAVLEGDRHTFNFGFTDSVFFWLIRPLSKADTLWALKKFDEVESASLSPYFKIKEFRESLSQDMESIPWYFYISRNLFSNFGSSWLKEAILEAVMGTGQIGIACKIFKTKEGRFPEKISELVPDILAEEPVDPFTGDPFIFKLHEEGYIVYSVGSNEKDDGGRATFQVTKLVMEKDDDWPWRENVN